MKTKLNTTLLAGVVIATLSFISCDNPKTIAWSYYHCAEDALNEGDLQKAKEYLGCVNKDVDKNLSAKTDSLAAVIEQQLSEKSDSI